MKKIALKYLSLTLAAALSAQSLAIANTSADSAVQSATLKAAQTKAKTDLATVLFRIKILEDIASPGLISQYKDNAREIWIGSALFAIVVVGFGAATNKLKVAMSGFGSIAFFTLGLSTTSSYNDYLAEKSKLQALPEDQRLALHKEALILAKQLEASIAATEASINSLQKLSVQQN